MFNNINMKYKTGVSKLTGAMGPKTEALWPKINGTTGAIYSMGASPLIYNTTTGIYNTAYDANAAVSSPSFKKFSYGKKRRKSKKKSKRRKRRSKRKSIKKWKNPSRNQRKAMMDRCGASCFLHPDELKFPVCNPDCSYNQAGLEAAYIRAKQWGYTAVAKKAKSLMKKKSKSRKRSVKRRSRKTRRRRSRKTRRRRSFGAHCVGRQVHLDDGERYDQNNPDHQYGACEPGGSLYRPQPLMQPPQGPYY